MVEGDALLGDDLVAVELERDEAGADEAADQELALPVRLSIQLNIMRQDYILLSIEQLHQETTKQS